MIKTFEQFVNECYNKPEGNIVNEAFQSSKLREIIKQHGKPKYSWENKMLYDLKDEEIVDILNNRSEYWDKYSNEKTDDGQATFILELEDGTVVVISNLNILKKWWDNDRDVERKKDELFKKRYAERHKGNLGKGGDEIHKKHLENVNKIERRRFAEYLQPNIQEIVDEVKSIMNDLDPSDFEEGEKYIESELTLNGDEYTIIVNYDCSSDDGKKRYGAVYYNVHYYLNSFEIWNDDDIFVTDEDLGITEKTHKDLFKEYSEEVEGEIYDYYNYYGVSRSDFY